MRQPLRTFEPPPPMSPEDARELLFDPIERGRRLSAFKKAIEGKVLIQVRRGEWEYVTPGAAPRGRGRPPASRNFTPATRA